MLPSIKFSLFNFRIVNSTTTRTSISGIIKNPYKDFEPLEEEPLTKKFNPFIDYKPTRIIKPEDSAWFEGRISMIDRYKVAEHLNNQNQNQNQNQNKKNIFRSMLKFIKNTLKRLST